MGIHIIKMPDIGEGIAEVELVAWHVKVGDVVTEDQILADVMTDKATVEIPSSVAGTVLALGGAVGQVMAVGSEVIRIEVVGAGNLKIESAVAAPAIAQSQPAAGPPPAIDGPGMDSVPVEAPAAEVPGPAPAAAALPLSSATIARTIERIGYPCGKVGSTAQGSGSGVFTVNCTSGHAYRASPVRGRYHFRPVSRP